jgi:hypothetical protein
MRLLAAASILIMTVAPSVAQDPAQHEHAAPERLGRVHWDKGQGT